MSLTFAVGAVRGPPRSACPAHERAATSGQWSPGAAARSGRIPAGRGHRPTLLIVGGADRTVMALNKLALAGLRCTKELVVVPGATHLFEEPGALEQVAAHAARWFAQHLAPQLAWQR